MYGAVDIPKLRRFALAVGLIVLAYLVLDMHPRESAQANLPWLGSVLAIGRPQLIPLFLIAASIYAGGSYFFGALMRMDSPRVFTKYVLGRPPDKAGTWEHEVLFSTLQEATEFSNKVTRSFPHFGGTAVRSNIFQNNGQFAAQLTIPERCKFLARVHDVEYNPPLGAQRGGSTVSNLGILFSDGYRSNCDPTCGAWHWCGVGLTTSAVKVGAGLHDLGPASPTGLCA